MVELDSIRVKVPFNSLSVPQLYAVGLTPSRGTGPQGWINLSHH